MKFLIEVYGEDDEFIANMLRKYAEKLLQTETDVDKLMTAMERYCLEFVWTWLVNHDDYVLVTLVDDNKKWIGQYHMDGSA